MVNPFAFISSAFTQLNQQKKYMVLGGILGTLILFFAFLSYRHFSIIADYKQRFQRVNELRKQAKVLLEKNEQVKRQQEYVQDIITKDRTFRIKEFFISTLQELGLARFSSKDPVVREPEDIDEQFAEITLDASFAGLTMKEVATLLFALEKNERIYCKEITITKALKTPTLDVSLLIATLQEKVEAV